MSRLAGRVVILPEQDYQYGTGSLRLRVEHVDVTDLVIERGERWYWVEGVQVRDTGEDVRPRTVLVHGRHLVG